MTQNFKTVVTQKYDELNSLRINKATGPDGVGNIVLKRTAKTLHRLFIYSLHRGTFPPTLCSNYCPIHLFPNKSKLLEKIEHDKIYRYLIDNALLIQTILDLSLVIP